MRKENTPKDYAAGICALRATGLSPANWRCRHGEIDIIARRRGVLAFIEIKARPDMMQAGQAVMARSRRRVSMAAAVFLASQPNLSRKTTRFDVMMVLPGRLPIHHADGLAD